MRLRQRLCGRPRRRRRRRCESGRRRHIRRHLCRSQGELSHPLSGRKGRRLSNATRLALVYIHAVVRRYHLTTHRLSRIRRASLLRTWNDLCVHSIVFLSAFKIQTCGVRCERSREVIGTLYLPSHVLCVRRPFEALVFDEKLVICMYDMRYVYETIQ